MSEVPFPPIINGLDFLLSVTEHLATGDDAVPARSLKYGVLHLHAAAEVLLKYRLQLEHWSLVFKDPGKARRTALESGNLASCTLDETITRLREIAGIPLPDKNTKALTKLRETRNALQHYGLTESAPAVEARAGEVLDILFRFVDEELMPALQGTDEWVTAEESMHRIRGGLQRIQGFVKKRTQRLKAELEPLRDRTVQCPSCGQWALVLDHGSVRCRFCAKHLPGEISAGWYAVASSATADRNGCRRCGEFAVVLGARVAAAPTAPVSLCFACRDSHPGPEGCHACGSPEELDGEHPLCRECQLAGVAV